IRAGAGATVEGGAVLGVIDGAGARPAAEATPQPAPAAAAQPAAATETARPAAPLSPAVRRLIEEHGLDPGQIPATGKDGRLTKEDVLRHIEARGAAGETQAAAAPAAPAPAEAKLETPRPAAPSAPPAARPAAGEKPREERVRMSRLRQRVAERLKQAQNTAAILTTFNEVDMSAVTALRAAYRDTFEKKHGVRLGIMSFFVKASIAALKEFPAVNAEIDGTDIVYKNHYDIGVAVGTEQGLVVPVVRDADAMSFAEIEKTIAELGRRARDGKLTIEELTGGTFTISNGGIYGSLLSTPILNPPQSGILGLHKIEKRPVAVDDRVEVRPMMYLALSYDHRIIDGREAVSFLVRIKECIEDPQRLLLDL
ncbi:MAG: 2-oxoglutarate dehydrogenase complex dihydrolipoyllysine-residue succinyltransferase, partial [Rhodospirillaceae bacterium]|nr:2-oxoglutarate dehydrogenase complex dihydrolipoyllysine-residue succinyltransferase [Rhodospirillaceae bacterium]